MPTKSEIEAARFRLHEEKRSGLVPQPAEVEPESDPAIDEKREDDFLSSWTEEGWS